eukprot:GILI01002935.1.p1 GENE.GILI01002935.1~~GILI01002935.1.p1  ORF type:complete len:1768 (-),score=493.11 GILI01002935.1:217-5520(-)
MVNRRNRVLLPLLGLLCLSLCACALESNSGAQSQFSPVKLFMSYVRDSSSKPVNCNILLESVITKFVDSTQKSDKLMSVDQHYKEIIEGLRINKFEFTPPHALYSELTTATPASTSLSVYKSRPVFRNWYGIIRKMVFQRMDEDSRAHAKARPAPTPTTTTTSTTTTPTTTDPKSVVAIKLPTRSPKPVDKASSSMDGDDSPSAAREMRENLELFGALPTLDIGNSDSAPSELHSRTQLDSNLHTAEPAAPVIKTQVSEISISSMDHPAADRFRATLQKMQADGEFDFTDPLADPSLPSIVEAAEMMSCFSDFLAPKYTSMAKSSSCKPTFTPPESVMATPINLSKYLSSFIEVSGVPVKPSASIPNPSPAPSAFDVVVNPNPKPVFTPIDVDSNPVSVPKPVQFHNEALRHSPISFDEYEQYNKPTNDIPMPAPASSSRPSLPPLTPAPIRTFQPVRLDAGPFASIPAQQQATSLSIAKHLDNVGWGSEPGEVPDTASSLIAPPKYKRQAAMDPARGIGLGLRGSLEGRTGTPPPAFDGEGHEGEADDIYSAPPKRGEVDHGEIEMIPGEEKSDSTAEKEAEGDYEGKDDLYRADSKKISTRGHRHRHRRHRDDYTAYSSEEDEGPDQDSDAFEVSALKSEIKKAIIQAQKIESGWDSSDSDSDEEEMVVLDDQQRVRKQIRNRHVLQWLQNPRVLYDSLFLSDLAPHPALLLDAALALSGKNIEYIDDVIKSASYSWLRSLARINYDIPNLRNCLAHLPLLKMMDVLVFNPRTIRGKLTLNELGIDFDDLPVPEGDRLAEVRDPKLLVTRHYLNPTDTNQFCQVIEPGFVPKADRSKKIGPEKYSLFGSAIAVMTKEELGKCRKRVLPMYTRSDWMQAKETKREEFCYQLGQVEPDFAKFKQICPHFQHLYSFDEKFPELKPSASPIFRALHQSIGVDSSPKQFDVDDILDGYLLADILNEFIQNEKFELAHDIWNLQTRFQQSFSASVQKKDSATDDDEGVSAPAENAENFELLAGIARNKLTLSSKPKAHIPFEVQIPPRPYEVDAGKKHQKRRFGINKHNFRRKWGKYMDEWSWGAKVRVLPTLDYEEEAKEELFRQQQIGRYGPEPIPIEDFLGIEPGEQELDNDDEDSEANELADDEHEEGSPSDEGVDLPKGVTNSKFAPPKRPPRRKPNKKSVQCVKVKRLNSIYSFISNLISSGHAIRSYSMQHAANFADTAAFLNGEVKPIPFSVFMETFATEAGGVAAPVNHGHLVFEVDGPIVSGTVILHAGVTRRGVSEGPAFHPWRWGKQPSWIGWNLQGRAAFVEASANLLSASVSYAGLVTFYNEIRNLKDGGYGDSGVCFTPLFVVHNAAIYAAEGYYYERFLVDSQEDPGVDDVFTDHDLSKFIFQPHISVFTSMISAEAMDALLALTSAFKDKEWYEALSVGIYQTRDTVNIEAMDVPYDPAKCHRLASVVSSWPWGHGTEPFMHAFESFEAICDYLTKEDNRCYEGDAFDKIYFNKCLLEKCGKRKFDEFELPVLCPASPPGPLESTWGPSFTPASTYQDFNPKKILRVWEQSLSHYEPLNDFLKLIRQERSDISKSLCGIDIEEEMRKFDEESIALHPSLYRKVSSSNSNFPADKYDKWYQEKVRRLQNKHLRFCCVSPEGQKCMWQDRKEGNWELSNDSQGRSKIRCAAPNELNLFRLKKDPTTAEDAEGCCIPQAASGVLHNCNSAKSNAKCAPASSVPSKLDFSDMAKKAYLSVEVADWLPDEQLYEENSWE